MNAARQQLGPDPVLRFTNLAAEGGRGGMKPTLGDRREVAFLAHCYEVAPVSQLHRHSMPRRYAPSLQSLFHDRSTRLESNAWKKDCRSGGLLLSRLLYASAGQLYSPAGDEEYRDE